MKDIRIFVASSKELERERNALAFLVLAKEDEFAARGLRVRLAKWEYVDPRMTEARTEDRYLDEMYDCDAALVLFRNVAGMYTREELDKALARERAGSSRLKAHEILFDAAGAPESDAARLRASLPEGSYGVWSGLEELRDRFLALVDRVAAMDGLRDAPSDANVRKITAFLASDEELADERDAFADTVLNVNDLLEQAHRNMRIVLRFYDPAHAEGVVESSEMGLVLYGTNCRFFGKDEIERTYARVKDGNRNPKRFYVFFHDLDEARESALDDAFRAFRDEFVSKLGHFVCQFGDANALRLGFLLSLERYAGETIEIYSTVAAPTTPVFAGRENELRRLCELLEPVPGKFPAGRLPVITGAGGTGKSELVRQYASQLRVQYPGGVFQVDMEHARTWDDVFLGLLNGVPNNGVRVEEYLGIKDADGGGGRNQEPSTGADVRDALLRKARTSGPMLLVLDNVEGCVSLLGRDGGFRKAFPSGFSERVRVNVVATARVCDAMLRDADWAVPFPLGDLPPDAALEVLLGDRPEADEAERRAAARVAELLGYRALYLRRVPALIGDLYAETVCDSYAELAKALGENLLGTVAAETEGTHLPDVLWKMTTDRLLRMPLGAECVKLAQIAAFFSPEGFPKHILQHLWKTVVAPGLDEKKFERAIAIVRHHNVFQSDDPVRIHRLDRAAILQTVQAEPGLEEAVGRSLAAYEGMSPKDWLLLADHIGILRFIPDCFRIYKRHMFTVAEFFSDAFSDSLETMQLQARLLCQNPAFESEFRWEELDRSDWAELLGKQPQFGDRCPWEKLTGQDWAQLLNEQPQFADRCQWEKLDGSDWGRLLGDQPQFAGHCQWERLNGSDWARLLEEQPQFTDRCRWENLDGNDWARLLGGQPQLEDRCPWETLDGNDWTRLLKEQPQFADKCPLKELTGQDWAQLLNKQPQFANRCPWEKLDGWDWTVLLEEQPQFSNLCAWVKLDGKNWTHLLEKQPHFANYCPWEKLDGGDWERLLEKQPQFADHCSWETLDGSDWVSLLKKQPQFADRCQWENLGRSDWARLLGDQPQFADRCPWETLDGSDWACLLGDQPQLENRCPWEKLDGFDWAGLIEEQPQFASRCQWEKLDGSDWSRLLGDQPQFAGRCQWEKLDGSDWAHLIGRQPQFADFCQWEKLDGSDWFDLLRGDQPGVPARPQFADRCPWEKFDGDDLERLLRDQPQFVDRCPWEKLDGSNWAFLLGGQPQIADRCPWEKLSGYDWAHLLKEQPQFADRCPWEKLAAYDWAQLLEEQPQFAGKCPCWDKLDDCEAMTLIHEQPELRAYFPAARLQQLEERSKDPDDPVFHPMSSNCF